MNASWWKGPEYNGVKVIVLVAIIALAGYFIYSNMQQGSLDNTGKIVRGSGTGTSGSSTGSGTGTSTGTGTGGGSGGGPLTGKYHGGGRDPVCTKGSTVALDPSADNASYAGGALYFDQNYQDGGHFIIDNNTECPLTVTQIAFSVSAPAYPVAGWTPLGGVYDPTTSTVGTLKLHVGSGVTPTTVITPGGSSITFNRPTDLPLFGTPLVKPVPGTFLGTPAFPRTLTFNGSVVIPALTSQDFALEVSSWNMPPAASAATSPANIKFTLRKVVATNTVGAIPNPYTWDFATSGLTLPSVTSNPMHIVMIP